MARSARELKNVNILQRRGLSPEMAERMAGGALHISGTPGEKSGQRSGGVEEPPMSRPPVIRDIHRDKFKGLNLSVSRGTPDKVLEDMPLGQAAKIMSEIAAATAAKSSPAEIKAPELPPMSQYHSSGAITHPYSDVSRVRNPQHPRHIEPVGRQRSGAITYAYPHDLGDEPIQTSGPFPSQMRPSGVITHPYNPAELDDLGSATMASRRMGTALNAEIRLPDIELMENEPPTSRVRTYPYELDDMANKDMRRKVGEQYEQFTGKSAEGLVEDVRDREIARAEAALEKGDATEDEVKQLKFAWENIFNILPKEDFGMALLQFGAATLMASETMGDAGALGAGVAAFAGGITERKRYRDATALQQEELDRTPPETLSTTGGLLEWKDGDWQAMTDDEGQPRHEFSSGNRPYADQVKLQQLKQAFPGMSEQMLSVMAYLNVNPWEEQAKAVDSFEQAMRNGYVFIPGKGRVSAREITDADKQNYINAYVQDIFGGLNVPAPQRNTGALGTPNPTPKGPFSSAEEFEAWKATTEWADTPITFEQFTGEYDSE